MQKEGITGGDVLSSPNSNTLLSIVPRLLFGIDWAALTGFPHALFPCAAWAQNLPRDRTHTLSLLVS